MPILTTATSADTHGRSGYNWADLLTLGELILNGDRDQYGVRWDVSEFNGWSSPATEAEPTQKVNDHGAVPARPTLLPRVLEIVGMFHALDHRAAHEAEERLLSAVPLLDLAELTVIEPHMTRRVMVQQSGQPLCRVMGERAEFSLSLIAPDPRKYSTNVVTGSTGLPATSGGLTLPLTFPLTLGATVSSGRIVALNEGNFETPPTLTVHGPCPPHTLTCNGRALRYHASLAAGRTLVYDTLTRRALLDGRVARTVTGSWFRFEPGSNEVGFTAATAEPAALLTSDHRHAWR